MICGPGFVLLTFDSIHDVLKAEKLLLRLGLSCDLVPTPRTLSRDCGMAIECRRADQASLQDLKLRGELFYKGLHVADA